MKFIFLFQIYGDIMRIEQKRPKRIWAERQKERNIVTREIILSFFRFILRTMQLELGDIGVSMSQLRALKF